MRTFSQYVRVAVFAAVATGGAVFLALNGWPQPDHVREFAGLVYASAWPMQAAPIAGAVGVYAFVKIAVAEAIAPVVNDEPFNRSWMAAIPRCAPTYFVAAGIAAGLVEIVNRGAWQLLPAAAIPLFCAQRAYAAALARAAADDRRRQVIDSLNQGMAVLDGAGCVTVWNDALERLLECPRERAVGCTLASAVPALAQTPLPRAIDEARTSRSARALSPLPLS